MIDDVLIADLADQLIQPVGRGNDAAVVRRDCDLFVLVRRVKNV
jgi:hypothetical protein